jgi:hypothetical protein
MKSPGSTLTVHRAVEVDLEETYMRAAAADAYLA